MNLLNEKDNITKLRNQLIGLRKELMGKMTEKGESVSEDLRYAFEYIDETIKSLANANMCLYHANIFLEKCEK